MRGEGSYEEQLLEPERSGIGRVLTHLESVSFKFTRLRAFDESLNQCLGGGFGVLGGLWWKGLSTYANFVLLCTSVVGVPRGGALCKQCERQKVLNGNKQRGLQLGP